MGLESFGVAAVQIDGYQSITVEVAGLVLTVRATRSDDLALIQRIVGTSPGEGPPDAVVTIADAAPAMPDRPPDFEGPYGDHWDDGSAHHFSHHWGLGAVVTEGSALLGGTASGHARWVTVRNSMLFVLARLFLERGRFMLHAAALRRRDDAVLVLGDSGSGKSTLAYAAGLAGWHVLADDMVVVWPSNGTTTIQGVPRAPSVPGDLAAGPDGFEAEQIGAEGIGSQPAGEVLADDERDRIELVAHQLDRRPAEVRWVLNCGHDPGPGRLRTIPPARAVELLVPAFVLSALRDPVSRWFPVAMHLARLDCTQLDHCADPRHRAARAVEMLEEAIGG